MVEETHNEDDSDGEEEQNLDQNEAAPQEDSKANARG